MVCDLQGVYSPNEGRPVFEFTDPVIHYRSQTGRKNVFGRTDRGAQGVHDFFTTHTCTELCRMLNRKWLLNLDAKLLDHFKDAGLVGGANETLNHNNHII